MRPLKREDYSTIPRLIGINVAALCYLLLRYVYVLYRSFIYCQKIFQQFSVLKFVTSCSRLNTGIGRKVAVVGRVLIVFFFFFFNLNQNDNTSTMTGGNSSQSLLRDANYFI